MQYRVLGNGCTDECKTVFLKPLAEATKFIKNIICFTNKEAPFNCIIINSLIYGCLWPWIMLCHMHCSGSINFDSRTCRKWQVMCVARPWLCWWWTKGRALLYSFCFSWEWVIYALVRVVLKSISHICIGTAFICSFVIIGTVNDQLNLRVHSEFVYAKHF